MAKKYKYLKKVKNFENLDLNEKTVTILGLEGAGSVIAEILARAGVNLRLIDKGRVYEEDLQSQSLYEEEDVTRFKAKQAKKRLEEINKDIKVKAFHEELKEETIYLLDSDLIIDCTNKNDTSKMISKYALSQEIPCLFVNVSASKVSIIPQFDSSVEDKVVNVDIDKSGVLGASVYFAASKAVLYSYKILLEDKNLKVVEIETF
ncbi:MAG: HesA/MoeB/ThiF family protein [Candidatus Woesearchaeota archaeon]